MEETEARCSTVDCNGVAVYRDHCVGHLDEDEFPFFAANLDPDRILHARGARIDTIHCELLVHLLKDAQFTGGADFEGARFTGKADFGLAQFMGDTSFRATSFGGATDFMWTRFHGDADFQGAQFTRRVNFAEATFTHNASFQTAQFAGEASFYGANFGMGEYGGASFHGAQFEGWTEFHGTYFRERAFFDNATFAGGADLSARFKDGANFTNARFTERTTIGGDFSASATFKRSIFGAAVAFRGTRWDGVPEQLRVDGQLDFSDVDFQGPVEIWVECQGRIKVDRVRCRDAMTLTANVGDISLERTQFAAPATITAVSRLRTTKGSDRRCCVG
jgi:uncharacterized protein YjbI with pentapeptide repeats